MIAGQAKMGEKEYRALPEISYSSIKDFDKNRVRFYKKYILGDTSSLKEDIEEKESVILGSVVDCLMTGTQHDFDQKFATINTAKKSGQMADFGDELWRLTKQYTTDGIVLRDFTDLAEEAFNNVKFKKGEEVAFKGKDFNTTLTKFIGSDEELLYKERRDKVGFIIISLDELNKAEKIKDALLETDWTGDIFNHQNSDTFTIHNQLIVQFELCGIKVKSMLDRVEIDHINKTIQPYDLKVSYLVNNFGYSYWKQKYYLQVPMYDLALTAWKDEQNLDDYNLLPMKFIVADSTCQCKPVIWECSVENVVEGLNGFTLNTGRKIKGLIELVEEIKWCSENSIWTTPKEVFDNSGVMKIRPFETAETDE